MPRRFNTAGPNDPARHYTLPVMRRLPEVRGLIEDQLYFVVHAPRQVGKTTALMSLARELTAEGSHVAALVSMEAGAGFVDDVDATELAVLASWLSDVEAQLPVELLPPAWPEAVPGARIRTALDAWARAAPLPLVLFLDEIDALEGRALISVLRQIRAGYPWRPRGFPSSLGLIGMRDVRDYKLASGGADRAHSSSPFNIKSDSLTMRNFGRDEVAELYGQHTAETGQVFAPEAVERAYALTLGQPWLVNALARQLVQVLVPDPAQAITRADVDTARDILIERQDTHLDSLAERLREPRVRAIIEPMLAGTAPGALPPDDIRFVLDLGLVRMGDMGGLEIANPIYREIIVRVLAYGSQASLPVIKPTWLTAEGRLDAERLLQAFLSFWRRHGEALLGTAPYHEIAPHLVLMAFLHRVVNGGGSVEREYAIGSGRMDLCVRHGDATLAIEIKVWRRDGDPDPLDEGLVQLDGYLAGLGLGGGWLIIFDRRPGAPPLTERLGAAPAISPTGRAIIVVRA
jgi:hypothetical protein